MKIESIKINNVEYDIKDNNALHQSSLVTEISSESTDEQIPSAKAVYEAMPQSSSFEDVSNKVTTVDEDSTDEQYASAKCVYNLVGKLEERLEEV